MYDPFKKFRACEFCKIRDKNLKYVRRRGIYGEAGWNYAYHEGCLKTIVCDPEGHSHIDVDMAIEVTGLIKAWEKEDERERMSREKWARESCDYLSERGE